MLVTTERLSIDIDRRDIWRNIGYSAECEPTAGISASVDEYIENARQLIEPIHAYVMKNVHVVRDSVVLIDDSIVFQSHVISRLLERCCMVAVFVATIGSRLEEEAARLAEDGLILQSYVLDSIGSHAVEIVADYVHDMTRKMAAADGLAVGRRFSPGYCDWDVRQQKVIFEAVNADSIGVQLTDQCHMSPRKSISGIIGIGPSEGGLEEYNPCTTCDRRSCLGRR